MEEIKKRWLLAKEEEEDWEDEDWDDEEWEDDEDWEDDEEWFIRPLFK
ncbi:MAG: hypothetical protein ABIL76_03250 [candidate division WOR-3 bacterium]